jgi:hypothetical protein
LVVTFGGVETDTNGLFLLKSGEFNLQFWHEARQLTGKDPNPANLMATAILDHADLSIQKLAVEFRQEHDQDRELLRAAHGHIAKVVRPIYTLDELQCASDTLRKRGRAASEWPAWKLCRALRA